MCQREKMECILASNTSLGTMRIHMSYAILFFLFLGSFCMAQNGNGTSAISVQTSNTYTLEQVGLINTEQSDTAPMFYQGKLIFASTGHSKKDNTTSNLYQSTLENNLGYYISAEAFGDKLTSKDAESTTTFSKDGNTIYFTRRSGGRSSIFKATKKNGKWGRPKEIAIGDKKYSKQHPALNADDTRLYFASDMPGTLGLTDIWYVTISKNGKYSDPVNAGKSVNTEGVETYPFISANGNLYFASDTHPGLGGLDVFEASQERGEIKNLGAPINSEFDEFSFVIQDDTQIGFFASNRDTGMGQDDIYKFSKSDLCLIATQGVILDKQSNRAIAGTQVELLDANNTIIESTVSDSSGNYSFTATQCNTSYRIRAFQAEYRSNTIGLTTKAVQDSFGTPVFLEPNLKTARLGDDLAKVLRLNAISFGVDRFNIQPEAALELDKVIAFMLANPSLKIDVRSHTDSRSRDSYNQQLSNKRNASTIAYLIEKGINKRRITGKGYGESQPLNRCSNGVKCSEEEHQINRRSEFIVVSK